MNVEWKVVVATDCDGLEDALNKYDQEGYTLREIIPDFAKPSADYYTCVFIRERSEAE